MEGALVSAATGALKPVLVKLATLMGNEYKRFKDTRKEIEFLTRELAAMEAFLLKMSEVENPDVQDTAWMKEVRELSYDIEDNLDDFMGRVGDRSAKPDGFMDKIKNLLDRTKAHRGIAKEIEVLKIQVNEVSERHARYKTGEATSKPSNTTIDYRALAIFKDASRLVGIDGPKGKLIQLLTQEARCESTHQQPKGKLIRWLTKEARCGSTPQQPKLISIVGFGGLGKTTLAYQVYRQLKGQFDCHAFLSVSRNPDTKEVLRTILSKVNGYSSGMDDIAQLITDISDFLANKRYFIVVDDIWDVEIWDVIKLVFPLNGCESRIITTTRLNNVAQSCCSSFNGHIYNMEPLSMVHSRQLFHKRLFNYVECPSQLQEVSGQILKKCAGLPLAIIAISGLLAGKEKTKDQWYQVDRSIGHGLERNPCIERMIKIISLSYIDLPHHLKTCLLYLSIFPEDHIIEKKMLIRRWIAEGFIHNEDRCTLYEAGEVCFNELINRSLIQPDFFLQRFDEVTGCRVHDTVLDFIVSKSIEENFVTIMGVPGINPGPQNKVHRLCLRNDSEIPVGLDLSHVRSLSVFGHHVKIPSFLEFKVLRVLSFEDSEKLEYHHLTNIGNLFHLKYLRLHDTNVQKLPEEIYRLKYLQTIEIVGIPMDVRTVRNEIGGMQALQVLEGIAVFRQSTNFLRQLGDLTNLRNLAIHVHSNEILEEMCSSIRKLVKANLRSLVIYMFREEPRNFLDGLRLPGQCSLRELVIGGYGVSKVPRWMGFLVNLQKLRLYLTSISEEDIEILGGLPGLRDIWVGYRSSVEVSHLKTMERLIGAHPNHPMLTCLPY